MGRILSRLEQLQEKLRRRSPVLATTIANLAWSGLIQKAASYPIDLMILDLEHGTLSVESAEELLRVCRLCDLPAAVRVPDTVPHLISKALDIGADGVLLPRVERVEQVELAIRAARYYPAGRKGCGGFSNFRPEDHGSVMQYNGNRLLFLQMESREGLEALPQILGRFRTELSGVVIGPYDASIMLETPLEIESGEMTAFIRRVFAHCAESGISCGSFVDHAGLLQRYLELGANIFWTGTELSLLDGAYHSLCQRFRQTVLEGK